MIIHSPVYVSIIIYNPQWYSFVSANHIMKNLKLRAIGKRIMFRYPTARVGGNSKFCKLLLAGTKSVNAGYRTHLINPFYVIW